MTIVQKISINQYPIQRLSKPKRRNTMNTEAKYGLLSFLGEGEGYFLPKKAQREKQVRWKDTHCSLKVFKVFCLLILRTRIIVFLYFIYRPRSGDPVCTRGLPDQIIREVCESLHICNPGGLV